MRVLRDGVLGGATVVVAGAGELGGAVRDRARALGAAVLELDAFEGVADVLVWDGAAAYAAARGADGARAALDGAWLAIRPVATAAMIERGGGRILLLAPAPCDAGAEAARAGLENLARTLSVEWARFGVR